MYILDCCHLYSGEAMKYIFLLLLLTGCQMSVGPDYPNRYKITITHKGESVLLNIRPGKLKEPIIDDSGEWKVRIEPE